MNAKHENTLEKIFHNPVLSGIKWRDIENMLSFLGATIEEGSGSRVRVVLNDIKAIFHRPHPDPDVKKGAVKALRKFLKEAGVRP
jgi:hypothetical protein